MFLLQIQNNKKINIANFNQILKIKILIEKLKNKILFLEHVKDNRKLKSLKLFLSKKNQDLDIQGNLIKYIIGISLLKTNTFIYVTDIKGQLKFSCSAGLINLSGKQKIKKPLVLINLLKLISTKINFISTKPVALHLINFNKYYEQFALNILKIKFFIKIIRNYNIQPHNGCRPKKLKRTKRKKFFFN
jgi:ribosomal protein S11